MDRGGGGVSIGNACTSACTENTECHLSTTPTPTPASAALPGETIATSSSYHYSAHSGHSEPAGARCPRGCIVQPLRKCLRLMEKLARAALMHEGELRSFGLRPFFVNHVLNLKDEETLNLFILEKGMEFFCFIVFTASSK